MDAYLYVVALAIFGILYLVLGVFLVFALLISLLAIYVYLVLRHGQLPDNYPFGAGDTIITVVFIGVTWAIFTALGPKPLQFVGSGLTYSSATVIPLDAVILISVIVVFSFLVIGAFVADRLPTRGRSGGGSQGGQQTVGSG
ncbi:MAG: hypothetical protein ABSB90_04340 [Thermoplasmata archaeon]|jgi:hypothetical protein